MSDIKYEIPRGALAAACNRTINCIKRIRELEDKIALVEKRLTTKRRKFVLFGPVSETTETDEQVLARVGKSSFLDDELRLAIMLLGIAAVSVKAVPVTDKQAKHLLFDDGFNFVAFSNHRDKLRKLDPQWLDAKLAEWKKEDGEQPQTKTQNEQTTGTQHN